MPRPNQYEQEENPACPVCVGACVYSMYLKIERRRGDERHYYCGPQQQMNGFERVERVSTTVYQCELPGELHDD